MKKLVSLVVGMLFVAMSAFTQEATISEWGYGLEASMGVISGNELASNYSVSFQSLHDSGSGWSLDYIYGVNLGLLGSMFLGLPLSKYFIPYVGGGLGVKVNEDDIGFAWKVDGGVAAWLFDTMYVKAGVMYDNIREDLGVSVGMGFKMDKTVSATYRDYDGTFRKTFTKSLWQDNSTPNSVYEDEFESSEVVRTYQKTTTTSTLTGGKLGWGIVGEGVPPPTEGEVSKITTHTYLWNVTVTRHWYTRTFYYKDRDPTTERVYQDTETPVLVNTFSETR
jgi:hypothetical protein